MVKTHPESAVADAENSIIYLNAAPRDGQFESRPTHDLSMRLRARRTPIETLAQVNAAVRWRSPNYWPEQSASYRQSKLSHARVPQEKSAYT